MSKKIMIRILSILVGCTLVTVAVGQGCSPSHKKKRSSASSGNGPLDGDHQVPNESLPTGLEAKPDTRTISLAYGKQVLAHMVSCSGLGNPSKATRDEWRNRLSTFSDFGHATKVNAPMLMAFTALAGQVCSDLIEKEKLLADGDRAIFQSVDLSADASSISPDLVGTISNRLARSCWQRNLEESELQSIRSHFDEAFAGESAGAETAALFLCSGMISALPSIEM